MSPRDYGSPLRQENSDVRCDQRDHAHGDYADAGGLSGPDRPECVWRDVPGPNRVYANDAPGDRGHYRGRIRDGEPQTVALGTACQFRISANDWVNVALGPIDAKTFATVRKLLGARAETLAGVGDEAYLEGNLRVAARVGTQSLIIGLARNDQGNANTKAQVLALAKLGASRLR